MIYSSILNNFNKNERKLGNTDIELTSIDLVEPSGNLFEELNETDCFNIIKIFEMSINLFDTSPLYGYGQVSTELEISKPVDPNNYIFQQRLDILLLKELFKEGTGSYKFYTKYRLFI